MHYHDKIRHYFDNPTRIGELNDVPNVAKSLVSANQYAASLQLHIAIENDRIVDSAIKVKGCPYTIACACFMAENIINTPIDNIEHCTARAIGKALEIPPGKFYAALLAEDSLKTAIKNKREQHE